VLFFGNKGRSRSSGGRPSRAPVKPGGAGPPLGAPPRPGADVCFIENEVIFFSRKQRSLSLDRTKVRLQTHLYRGYYSTPVLCCQVQDVSRIGPSRADDPPRTTWRGEGTPTPSRAPGADRAQRADPATRSGRRSAAHCLKRKATCIIMLPNQVPGQGLKGVSI
jgi:hypothetical protein